jgi:predicted RNase H-like HicB family nuclease
MRQPEQGLVAVVEPPDDDDPNWVVEAPAIHYQAQGKTRREALARFESGLAEAFEWAMEHGARHRLREQPEVVEYVL